MKRSLIIMAFAGLLAVSCGTVGTTSTASRFQDGIYYQAQEPEFTPLTEEEIAARASLGLKSKQYDTLVLVVEPYLYGGFRPYPWYGRYGWYGWNGWYGYRPYGPGFAWSCWDPFWDPYWDPYWYGPSFWYDPWYYHYHHHYYPSYGHSNSYKWAAHPGVSRSSSGVVSRGAAAPIPRSSSVSRSSSAARSSSVNRGSSVNAVSPATRSSNSASYNSGVQRQSVPRSSAGSSMRSSGSSMSRSSGGGSMSRGSSGSMSHGGSGRR